jgi:5-methylcytosine-specific restriction endonuclease McrA
MNKIICCHCKKEKDEKCFYNDKSRKNGKKPRCKECESLYVPKHIKREREKEYWSKNKERKKEIVKKSMLKNKEHHKNQRKKYLKTEKGKLSYKKYTQKRYALKKSKIIGNNIHFLKIYERDNKKCVYCGKDLLFNDVHFDHYIPLSKGGEHTYKNLKTSCKSCNLSKGAKMPEQFEAAYQMV